MVDAICAAFAPLIGLPAWNVSRGHGSMLTMEFGDPHLDVREPLRTAVSPQLRRRRVEPRGAWHLWIGDGHWCILDGSREIASHQADGNQIDAGAAFLDGQRLLAIEADTSTASCRFRFDLDGTLEVRPGDDVSTPAWHLYLPDGNVLTVLGDGNCKIAAANIAS